MAGFISEVVVTFQNVIIRFQMNTAIIHPYSKSVALVSTSEKKHYKQSLMWLLKKTIELHALLVFGFLIIHYIGNMTLMVLNPGNIDIKVENTDFWKIQNYKGYNGNNTPFQQLYNKRINTFVWLTSLK